MVPRKNKGKAAAVATWPKLLQSSTIPSDESSSGSRYSQPAFARPRRAYGGSRATNQEPAAVNGLRREAHSSHTWTSSSECPEVTSEEDVKDNREQFIREYNRLAHRHGIRPFVPQDFAASGTGDTLGRRRGSWFSKMLRQTSEQSERATAKSDQPTLQHQRSIGDVALNFVQGHKRDELKNKDLKALIRLCGKSHLFLPAEYAPFSLTLPTCIRALAQALVQHANTRGIFRISGSTRVINALYDYYCTDDSTDAVSSTTRCPTLPTHIRCNPHDIASTFKRFLAGLPGGILGSLSLFDALVAIHTQIQNDVELHRTKDSKVRARLIALAIGTVESQYRRELICAVFGLLCLVGRVAENAPREDDDGHPLPTTNLMGYNALGIVFGPLLVGDMIDGYSMKVADPSAGLLLLPVSPPKSRKERHQHQHQHQPKYRHGKNDAPSAMSSLSLDKTHITNSITEMLIVHWREVVRQIRSTGSVKDRRDAPGPQYPEGISNDMPSSVSGVVSLQNPVHWEHTQPRSVSPSTISQTSKPASVSSANKQDSPHDQWTPYSRGTSTFDFGPIEGQPTRVIPHLLSPTIEESPSPHINDAGVGDSSTFNQMQTLKGPAGVTQPQSDRVAIDGTRSGTFKFEQQSRYLANSALPKSYLRADSPRDDDTPRQKYVPKVFTGSPVTQSPVMDSPTMESPIRRVGHSKTMSLPGWSHGPPDTWKRTSDESDAPTKSPVDQWKRLVASSKASTESLAKLAKERRLKRGYGHTSSHPSQETSAPVNANPRPVTPEPKRWPFLERSQTMDMVTTEQHVVRSAVGRTMTTPTPPQQQTTVATLKNQKQRRFSTAGTGSPQRSISKPLPGAVKAIAALFDKAARVPPSKPVVMLGGTSKSAVLLSGTSSSLYHAEREPDDSNSSFAGYAASVGSSAKSNSKLSLPPLPPLPRHAPATTATATTAGSWVASAERATRGKAAGVWGADESYPPPGSSPNTVRPRAPVRRWSGTENTPSRRPTLRPVNTFSATSKQGSSPPLPPLPTTREADRSGRPLWLGNYRKGSPSGHSAHIGLATSTVQGQQQYHGGVEETIATTTTAAAPTVMSRERSESLRPAAPRASSTPVLTSSSPDARIRNLQLQLARRDDELAQLWRRLDERSEQLRGTKRECASWRTRAEAAERRVAAFQRFGARIGGTPQQHQQHQPHRKQQIDGADKDDYNVYGDDSEYHVHEKDDDEGAQGGARDYFEGQQSAGYSWGGGDGASSSGSAHTEDPVIYRNQLRYALAEDVGSRRGNEAVLFGGDDRKIDNAVVNRMLRRTTSESTTVAQHAFI